MFVIWNAFEKGSLRIALNSLRNTMRHHKGISHWDVCESPPHDIHNMYYIYTKSATLLPSCCQTWSVFALFPFRNIPFCTCLFWAFTHEMRYTSLRCANTWTASFQHRLSEFDTFSAYFDSCDFNAMYLGIFVFLSFFFGPFFCQFSILIVFVFIRFTSVFYFLGILQNTSKCFRFFFIFHHFQIFIELFRNYLFFTSAIK